MLNKIQKFFNGYLLIKLVGNSPERFLNLCCSKNIFIWNIMQTDEGYTFYIDIKDFKRLKAIIRKTRVKLIILKRYGFPFILFRYRKRKVFFISIIFCSIIVYILSLYIWNISISGEYSNTKETIMEFLKTQEIYSGIMKKNINCQDIEDMIRKEYNDIGWVSAEIKGTRLIIKVNETNMPQIHEKQTMPCNIVAQKDGIITSIVTRNGTPVVSQGDVVKKGDILVSGVVKIIGDGDIQLGERLVISDADIRMKTFYDYEDKQNLMYINKIYTNNFCDGYSLQIFNKKIILYNPFKNYDKYDIIIDTQNLKLGENFFLPLSLIKISYYEYNEQKSKYQSEEIISIMNNRLNRYLNKLIEKEVTILENNVNIEINQNICIAKGKIIVEDSAWQYETIV